MSGNSASTECPHEKETYTAVRILKKMKAICILQAMIPTVVQYLSSFGEDGDKATCIVNSQQYCKIDKKNFHGYSSDGYFVKKQQNLHLEIQQADPPTR